MLTLVKDTAPRRNTVAIVSEYLGREHLSSQHEDYTLPEPLWTEAFNSLPEWIRKEQPETHFRFFGKRYYKG